MKLHFPADIVRKLVEHAKASADWSMGYETTKKAAPGLLLVGDRGVYLMSNGRPILPQAEGLTSSLVAYAKGIDPTVDKEDWWQIKREAFGGDDGVEYLPLTHFEEWLATDAKSIPLNVTPGQISMPPPPRKKVADADKVTVGTIIRFEETLIYKMPSGELATNTFRLAQRLGRKKIWSALKPNGKGTLEAVPGRFNIPNWDKRPFKIIETA